MDRQQAFQTFTRIISEQLGVDASAIDEQTRFSDLNADSLDMVELVMALEDEFGVQLEDDVVANIKTVADALDAAVA